MKAARLFFSSLVLMSCFTVVGCGEAENTIEAPTNPAPPPTEGMTEESNTAVLK